MNGASEVVRWNRVFYSGTDVLRNKLNIGDDSELALVEHEIANVYQQEISSGEVPITGDSPKHKLEFIHHYLFSELYCWAGKFRDVNMSKNGHTFGDFASMSMYMRQLENLLTRYPWHSASYTDKVHDLAQIHTELNFFHPFREGNGRTTRLYISDLAATQGITLDFDKVDKDHWHSACAETFLDPEGLRLDSQPFGKIYDDIATAGTA